MRAWSARTDAALSPSAAHAGIAIMRTKDASKARTPIVKSRPTNFKNVIVSVLLQRSPVKLMHQRTRGMPRKPAPGSQNALGINSGPKSLFRTRELHVCDFHGHHGL